AEEPVYRRFTSAEKAIIDIALIHTGTELLNVEQRAELQGYALAFENRLLALNEVSGLEKQGYLKPELQISIHPEKLRQFDISLAEVRNQIRTHNVRVPVGTM